MKMSAKRPATSQLNNDNWDQEDEPDDIGTFRNASKDVLEKRVIRTAKRRVTQPAGDEAKKNVFSSFGGFNKNQPTSFDFLSKLTNGNSNQTVNGSSKNDTVSSTSLFTSKPIASSTGIGNSLDMASTNNKPSLIFGSTGQVDSSKPTGMFGISSNTSGTNSLFGAAVSSTTTSATTTFKMQPLSSTSAATAQFKMPPALTSSTPANTSFKMSSISTSSPSANTSFKIPSLSTATSLANTTFQMPFVSTTSSGSTAFKMADPTASTSTNTPLKIMPEANASPLATTFKMGPATTPNIHSSTTFKMTPATTSISQSSTPIKLAPATTPNTQPSSLFKITPSSTSITPSSASFKMPPVSTNTISTFGVSSTPKPIANSVSSVKDIEKNHKNKVDEYFKLRCLNKSVAAWIKKNVDESPNCILIPIFRDYEKHLNDIEEEYNVSFLNAETGSDCRDKTDSSKQLTKLSPTIPSAANKSSVFGKANPPTSSPSMFTAASPDSASAGSLFSTKPSTGFSLGSTTPKSSVFSLGNTTSNFGTASPPSASFSFGINSSPALAPTASTASIETNKTPKSPVFSLGNVPSNFGIASPPSAPFSFGIKTSPIVAPAASSASFSFGTEKPFTFNSNISQKPKEEEKEKKEDDEDAPPKVEFTPIVEDNSVYDKRCKIFVKKDGSFADKGLATLFIKKIEESSKFQLVVRANTSLGNVLMNIILAKAIPTQRMGKNNVMIICIPTADAKPPPVTVLIRVKSSEEADELLETLNKYKT